MSASEPIPLKTSKRAEASCCGTIEAAAQRSREKKANRTTPHPWIVRKFVVAVTLGIMGYAVYVYAARLCVDMIRRREGAGGSRDTGIALIVVFSVLFLWMLWAYIKAILTPPGFARDHTPKCGQPIAPLTPFVPYDRDIEGVRYSQFRPSHSTAPSRDLDQESIGGLHYENISAHSQPRTSTTIAPPSSSHNGPLNGHANGHGHANGDAANKIPPKPTPAPREKAPVDYISRKPPLSPVLLPERRYCELDGIVKPYRTHHCRSCGTCVLKYDHHCPWIGQCVGARNQKFFLNFTQAASVFTIYVAATMIVFTVRAANKPDGDIDPQHIVIIALAAVFALFTTLLQISHVRLIWVGQTTLENLQARNMKEREKRVFSDVLGTCALA
ncbi:hypothetical protein DXG03_006843 [Asterophora parasitica]|uniref:Palmitoyltransferase n=1 Tax=Asterophora parasitica TaxID=117018 RepID=A0A9P7G8E6_9AGAR|nr:hypothetical protein DXG03_006843 [Asterophora parasitica]